MRPSWVDGPGGKLSIGLRLLFCNDIDEGGILMSGNFGERRRENYETCQCRRCSREQ
jgi:hypothetical protein